MENKKSKNILVVSGIQRGHFTGSVEIVRELSSLGHNVTCYVLDEYEERMKDTGAKVIAYKVDRNEIKKLRPPNTLPIIDNVFLFGRSLENIISLLSKDETKYDYYIFDSFFEINEMNKILKLPLDKFVLICVSNIFTDEDVLDFSQIRRWDLKD